MEKATLQQVLDDLVSKVNSNEAGQMGAHVYGSVVKENCKLKMEVSLEIVCTDYADKHFTYFTNPDISRSEIIPVS